MTDSTRRTTIDEAVLNALHQTNQIEPVNNITFYLAQEQQSLYRLRQRLTNTSQPLSPEQAYLSLYDCLFRHISIALLSQRYQVTTQDPHQTLRQILSKHTPDHQVQKMITHRHTLKKTKGALICEKSIMILTKLLNVYDIRDAQACQTLCLLPLQHIVTSSAKSSFV